MTPESKLSEVLKEMAEANLDHFCVYQGSISLEFQKHVDGELVSFQASTNGRMLLKSDGERRPEGDYDVSAIYTCLSQSLRSVSGANGVYRLEFGNGLVFDVSDPDRYGDYTLQVDVIDRKDTKNTATYLFE